MLILKIHRIRKLRKNFINTKFLIDTEFLQEYNKYILKKGDKIMSDENNFSVDTEQLKNETKDTVNQVKDTIKNSNFKEGAAQTKGFIAEMFSNPISAVKRVATGEENVLFKAIIIMIVYIVASFASQLVYTIKYGSFRGIGSNIISLVVSIIHPLIYILVPAVIIMILNKENKKALTTVISTLVVTAVPVVINSVIDIVENLVTGISIVTSPFSTMFSAISIILTYFGMKDLFGVEENESFIKKYAIIKLVAAFVFVILNRIGIY